MPGFTPLPHRPPSPPMQSVAAENGAMALERSLQFELQIRDQHIHQVEMDNVRLKVKLEEAEKDVRMATDMVMAACRSGNDTQQQAISPVKTMMASRAEEPRAATSALRARTATVEGGWGRTAAMDRVHDRGGYRYGSCFGGGWGDAGYRLRNGWGEFAESRE